MEYRVVKDRCAVDMEALELPITNQEALRLLHTLGFKEIVVDVIQLARDCIGTSKYRLNVKPSEAPGIINCSSFVKWLYGQRGIWLPRLTIQQRKFGDDVTDQPMIAGDLVFASGRITNWYDRLDDEVGHVGIVTGDRTIICSTNEPACAEISFDDFLRGRKRRGVRRYMPKAHKIVTLKIPSEMEVETADDIRWLILQTISKIRPR